jgi:hypothetical protein
MPGNAQAHWAGHHRLEPPSDIRSARLRVRLGPGDSRALLRVGGVADVRALLGQIAAG